MSDGPWCKCISKCFEENETFGIENGDVEGAGDEDEEMEDPDDCPKEEEPEKDKCNDPFAGTDPEGDDGPQPRPDGGTPLFPGDDRCEDENGMEVDCCYDDDGNIVPCEEDEDEEMEEEEIIIDPTSEDEEDGDVEIEEVVIPDEEEDEDDIPPLNDPKPKPEEEEVKPPDITPIFPVGGDVIVPDDLCTDTTAMNFNRPKPCVYPCKDVTANNFNMPLPCTYDPDDLLPDPVDPPPIDDVDPVDPVAIGCRDPLANNYDEDALIGDQSMCTYDPEDLCDDPMANNKGQPKPCTYDPEDLCITIGADNYGQPKPCILPPMDELCREPGAINIGFKLPCKFPRDVEDIEDIDFGAEKPTYNPPPPTTQVIKGCTDINANNYSWMANIDDGTCVYDEPEPIPEVCTDVNANNFNKPIPCTYDTTYDPGEDPFGNPFDDTSTGNCADPNATNWGKPLPCLYPEPEPKPITVLEPELCDDTFATNFGLPLPCLYDPEPEPEPLKPEPGEPLPVDDPDPPPIQEPVEIEFLDKKTMGKRFAFILDKSGSMHWGTADDVITSPNRWSVLLNQVTETLNNLPLNAEVYFTLFSGDLEPPPDYQYLPDVQFERSWVQVARRGEIIAWLKTIFPNGSTDPTGSIRRVFNAVNPKPDVIFFLSDGKFTVTQGTVTELYKQQNKRAKIETHTFTLVNAGAKGEMNNIIGESNVAMGYPRWRGPCTYTHLSFDSLT